MIATANVPVTYTTTGDWLSVAEQGSELTVKATENTTGKARVGWVIAKAAGLVDSLKVVQASLADFVGEYKQTAKMRNADRTLSERTSDVRIEAAGNNKANFIVDNKYAWAVDFIPGKGFKMTNGKVVAKNEVQTGVYDTLSLSSWLTTLVRSMRRLSMVRRKASSSLSTTLATLSSRRLRSLPLSKPSPLTVGTVSPILNQSWVPTVVSVRSMCSQNLRGSRGCSSRQVDE